MTPLITILLIHIGSDTFTALTYPSQMACGEALVVIAEATPPLGGRKTTPNASGRMRPSASPRPVARGETE
jgi:hypothetical protein